MATSSQRANVPAGREPIAIVGIGCRFPGASGPRAFWRMISDGLDAIAEIPADRFDVEAFYHPKHGTPGKMAYRWGGFIPDIEGFDAAFFGISPREAAYIDPQQRILLEIAWEALEDAGEVAELLAGSRTGVFIGQSNSDYEDTILTAGPDALDSLYMVAGSTGSMSSGRLAYALDLRGPSVTVDAACSSSLLAVHLACQSIWSGESSMALAGGVNIVLSPNAAIAFSQAGMTALDGRCKAFAAGGDGFVRSDGAGVVVLKPLARALAEANPVYAVIRGTGVSSDGRSGGLLMQPAQVGQEQAIRAAYQSAGIDPAEVQYVEAHGTGTAVGDPLEVAALSEVFGSGRTVDKPCLLGSVKTNIGHTEAAAGVAGLIKTALALHHRAIPASLHSAELNPAIPWNSIPFTVAQKLEPWPDTERALAGVSSFGISGTNVHAVLEAAPAQAAEPTDAGAQVADAGLGQWALLPLSARTPQALRDHAAAWRALLDSDDPQASTFQDLCYTASLRRTHHRYGLGVVARSRAEATERLAAFLTDDIAAGWVAGHSPAARRKVAFVFSGQGGQWAGMGATLWQREPVFRAAVERCAEAMRPFIDWSLLDEMTTLLDGADPGQRRAGQLADELLTDRVQPTLFALQVALAMLWKSWGITPDAVIGHSLGEVAAAHVAGALSLEDAARIVCRRSALQRRVSGRGGMAVIGLPLPDTESALTAYAGRLSVAASNSSSATVVSGDTAAIEEIVVELQALGVFCRRVKVDCAFHSAHMDGLREDLLAALQGLRPAGNQIPLYSTVTGELANGTDLDEQYWVRNLREPVLFAAAVTGALRDEHAVFVEVGPHPVLTGAVQQIGRDEGYETDVVASLRRDEDEQAVLLEALGRLHCLGQPVNWKGLYRRGGRCVALPAYPWQRDRHWSDLASRWRAGSSSDGIAAPRRRSDGTLAHPLLRRYLRSAARPELHVWETTLGPQVMRYLRDHRVANTVVFPAAGYVEMVLAAADEALGAGQFAIEDLTFSGLLVLPDNPPATLRLELIVEGDDQATFQIFSDTGASADRTPRVHAAGMLRLGRTSDEPTVVMDPAELRAGCDEPISRAAHYDWLGRSGIVAGPAFQGVEQIWRGDQEAVGRLRLPRELASDVGSYRIHPAQLDACLQVLWEALPRQDMEVPETDTYVPVGIKRLQLLTQPPAELWVHVRASTSDAANGHPAGDITVTDDDGRPVLLVESITAQRIGGHARPGNQDVDEWMYAIDWEKSEPCANAPLTEAPGRWLIISDARGTGSALTRALESVGTQAVQVSHGNSGEFAAEGSYQISATDPDAWTTVLREAASGGPLRGIVHLWSLDIPEPQTLTGEELNANQELGCVSVLHLVRSLASVQLDPAPRLYLVTGGVQAVGQLSAEPQVAQAPLWGMGRAVRYEHPELRCGLVDLSAASDQAEVEALCREICADSDESQVALRGPDRYVARLTPGVPRHDDDSPVEDALPVGSDYPCELVNPTLGILDNLEWRQTSRREPGPGEVEIGICAVGLIFRDVITAMGVDVGQPKNSFTPGYDCSGRITAVGQGVHSFKVGDEVIALGDYCMRSHVTLPEVHVMPKPAGLTFEEAAALPSAYATAYFSLCTQGRLAAGEKVLIHAAAGGVGLAAVQIARWIGAEIFATAGTPEKRAFLRSMGVQHVMDSRSLAFAEEVRELTGGKGVDVVLNSLRGVALERSLATLGQFGRFVEIGKRDFFEPSRRLGLQPFQKAVSFISVDLKGLAAAKPAFVGSIMREVVDIASTQGFAKPPVKVFGPDEVVDAFRYMAQGRHIGRIVLSLDGRQMRVRPAADTKPMFRDNATYLITGGMGGVGLVLAAWMVENGARHLVLASRRGTSGADANAVAALEEAGATVVVVQTDVSEADQVRAMLDRITAQMPPLRGIMHAAAVLDDGLATQLTGERMLSVMAPKVAGAWHLHRLTAQLPLDFFVLFSSVAGLVGSPGQANYCAGNTFLDALAALRHAQGLPALSIGWGNWAQVGMAARVENRGKRLASRGLARMRPEQALNALGRLLTRSVAQVAVVPFDLQRWSEYYPSVRNEPFFAHLRDTLVGTTPDRAVSDMVKAIRAAAPANRRQLIEDYLSEGAARTLGYSSGRVSIDDGLQQLGLDSLMALELRNAIERDLGVAAPVEAMLHGANLARLAQMLDERLTEGQAQRPTSTVEDVADLSDQEVEDLLAELAREERRSA